MKKKKLEDMDLQENFNKQTLPTLSKEVEEFIEQEFPKFTEEQRKVISDYANKTKKK